MSITGVSWLTESADGFFINITGFLSSRRSIWGGVLNSPGGRWQVTYPQTQLSIPMPGQFGYNFTNLSIAGKRQNSDFTFVTGGGFSRTFPSLPWGSYTGEIWTFKEGATTQTDWTGYARVDLTNYNAGATEYAKWRFSLDVSITRAPLVE